MVSLRQFSVVEEVIAKYSLSHRKVYFYERIGNLLTKTYQN